MRDANLILQIEGVFWDRKLGRGISGARKIWRLLKREGIGVARCTVERLMRQQGLRGIRRGKQFITTKADRPLLSYAFVRQVCSHYRREHASIPFGVGGAEDGRRAMLRLR